MISSNFSTSSYLTRLGYEGSQIPSTSLLKELHERHLFTIPFENLDIHLGRRITCDLDRFYEKIVIGGRGGFCSELNGLFGQLLRRIGFDVTLLSARVNNAAGVLGPELDHMALLIKSEGDRWLADVGFGDSFLLPLRVDTAGEQQDPAGKDALLANFGIDLDDWASRP